MLSQILKPQVIFAICKLLDVQTLQILHINNSMIIDLLALLSTTQMLMKHEYKSYLYENYYPS